MFLSVAIFIFYGNHSNDGNSPDDVHSEMFVEMSAELHKESHGPQIVGVVVLLSSLVKNMILSTTKR